MNMFRILFSRASTAKLNKYINRKFVLHACNNSSIPQLGVCKVIIKCKNTKLPGSSYAVPENSTGLRDAGLQEIRVAECELHNNGCKPKVKARSLNNLVKTILVQRKIQIQSTEYQTK